MEPGEQPPSERAVDLQFSFYTLQYALGFSDDPGKIMKAHRMPRTALPDAPRRAAFTLLEVLLALGLTAVVMVLVAVTLDVHLRAVDAGRTEVEEAQLARAILHRMADDLRGTVPNDPLQADQTMQLPVTADELTKALASGQSSGTGSGTGSGTSKTTGSPTTTPSSPSTTNQTTSGTPATGSTGDGTGTGTTTDQTITANPHPVPGLFGSSTALQVDVSRLPRLDQFYSQVSQAVDSPMTDRLSDVKTVTYYVIPPENATQMGTSRGTDVRTGLIRRELDRAVTVYAAEQGALDAMDQNLEPLAPEVAAIQFSYFDGTEWVTEWDSNQMGGLPWAVEIILGIIPVKQRQSSVPWQPNQQTVSPYSEGLIQYRLVVYLPAAQAALAQAGTGGSTGTEGSSSSGGNSSSTPAP